MNKKIILPMLVLSLTTFTFLYSEGGEMKKATFAGGCFWCMEPAFEMIDGVISVRSGYMGGAGAVPTYEDVSRGTTGHREVVQVTYDPNKVKYEKLLDVFWMQIDPTDEGGQFADRGKQYKTAVFFHDTKQKNIAENSKRDLGNSGKFSAPIVTEILKASQFYEAEEYHQDYSKKNPVRYKMYKEGSGRSAYIKKIWGENVKKKPDKEKLMKKLTPLQYKVTQEKSTEPAFNNEYWNNDEDGIYVDIVSGEALFSSKDKFKSGTGWPSFTRPIEKDNILEEEDSSLGMKRTEIKSSEACSHLGHVFNDGPGQTGLRYCVNSAALRFIPKERLKEEGYEQYEKLFHERDTQ